MSTTYFTVLTDSGQARITNALASGTPVVLSAVAVGDGNGAPVTVSENHSSLVREVYRGAVNSVTVDPDNPNWLVAEMVIPMSVGGWTIREIGLFDDFGVLLAYGNFPDSYKPILAEGSAKELAVRMYIETSGVAAVTLKVDPTAVLASRQYVVDETRRATRIGRPRFYFLGQF